MTTDQPDPYSDQNENPTNWAWTIATFFGAGFGKPGPGTWGSVAAVLLWAAYAWGLHPAPHTLLLALLAGIALTLLLGIPAATIVARESGRKDPQFVVIDEVAGQWIALLGCRARLASRPHRPRPLPPLRHHQALPRPPA